ncbi:putative DYRK-family kinase pom1 [Blattamonas nauphoetae]|uniref:DYRK-family kinase pom1 n=1 Tax=Blattamonas nauphoetae TaxID=2049346 RepID=A0ABQ9Y9D2_9EUKA|nr:putative DYRK-family kinase pom1 [Blattamonas nauphoetae]
MPELWEEHINLLSQVNFVLKLDDSIIDEAFNECDQLSTIENADVGFLALRKESVSHDAHSPVDISRFCLEFYSIVHQWFIETEAGLDQMCTHQLLPFGFSANYGLSSLMFYCPGCDDAYNIPLPQEAILDGSLFGPTFPKTFVTRFPNLVYPSRRLLNPFSIYQNLQPPQNSQTLYGFPVFRNSLHGARDEDTRRQQHIQAMEEDEIMKKNEFIQRQVNGESTVQITFIAPKSHKFEIQSSEYDESSDSSQLTDQMVDDLLNNRHQDEHIPLLCWPSSQRIWDPNVTDEWDPDDEVGISRRPVPQFLEEEIPSKEMIDLYEEEYIRMIRGRIDEKLRTQSNPHLPGPMEAMLYPHLTHRRTSFFEVSEFDDHPPTGPSIDASLTVEDLRKLLFLQPESNANTLSVNLYNKLKSMSENLELLPLEDAEYLIISSIMKAGGMNEQEIEDFITDGQNEEILLRMLIQNLFGVTIPTEPLNTQPEHQQNDLSSPLQTLSISSFTSDVASNSSFSKSFSQDPTNKELGDSSFDPLHHYRPPALMTPREPFRTLLTASTEPALNTFGDVSKTAGYIPRHSHRMSTDESDFPRSPRQSITVAMTPHLQTPKNSTPKSRTPKARTPQHLSPRILSPQGSPPSTPGSNNLPILSPSFISRLATIIPQGNRNRQERVQRRPKHTRTFSEVSLQSIGAPVSPLLPPSPPPNSPIIPIRKNPTRQTPSSLREDHKKNDVMVQPQAFSHAALFPTPIEEKVMDFVHVDVTETAVDESLSLSPIEVSSGPNEEHDQERLPEVVNLMCDLLRLQVEPPEKEENEDNADNAEFDEKQKEEEEAHYDPGFVHSLFASRCISAPFVISLPEGATFDYRHDSTTTDMMFPAGVNLPLPHPEEWLNQVETPTLVDGYICIPNEDEDDNEDEDVQNTLDAIERKEEEHQQTHKKTQGKGGGSGGGKKKKKLSKKQRKRQKKQEEENALKELAKLKNPPQPHRQSTPTKPANHSSRLPKHCPLCSTHQLDSFALRIISAPFATGIENNDELIMQPNQVLAGRFVVRDQIGSAAFSKAVECDDLETGDVVCMKVIKNNKEYFDQSIDEIKLLSYVNRHDPDDLFHIVRMYDFFYFKEHLIIVCELLKQNLYEFQKDLLDNDQPNYFTIPRLQKITKQVLESLAFLHSLGLMHCDLKPENILIKSYSRCEVKVIDLGSSCFVTDPLTFYTQSRSYRAPEVILGIPYGRKIDIWSLGCILAEMLTGRVLFVHESLPTLLGSMIGMLGPFSEDLLQQAKFRYHYFTVNNVLYDTQEDPEPDQPQFYFVHPKQTTLRARLGTDDALFVDFVSRLLTVDQNQRPSALEALQHPWFKIQYAEEE